MHRIDDIEASRSVERPDVHPESPFRHPGGGGPEPMTPAAWDTLTGGGWPFANTDALPAGEALETRSFCHAADTSRVVTLAGRSSGHDFHVQGMGDNNVLRNLHGAWGLAGEAQLRGGMPFRLGQKVFTFHRGSLLNAVWQAPHRALVNAQAGPFRPLPSPPAWHPVVRMTQATPRTQLATLHELREAIAARPSWRTSPQLVNAVSQHLDLHSGEPGRPMLLLLGEHHDYRSGVMVNTTALGRHRWNGGESPAPIYLIEATDQPFEVLDEAASDLDGQIRPLCQAPASAATVLACNELKPSEWNHYVLKALMANHAGFAIGLADPQRLTATDVAQREAAMVAAVREVLGATEGAPVVMSVGAGHVAALHEQLAAEANVVVVSVVDMPEDTPWIRQSMSYLLTVPDPKVLTYRVNPDLESDPFNFIQFAVDRGIDLFSMSRDSDEGGYGIASGSATR
jgi:hypothetical protein